MVQQKTRHVGLVSNLQTAGWSTDWQTGWWSGSLARSLSCSSTNPLSHWL